MPYLITEKCIESASCVLVCPVDCIYKNPDGMWINPDECIDCGLCEPVCPVRAITIDQTP